jgi:hypothetical protein
MMTDNDVRLVTAAPDRDSLRAANHCARDRAAALGETVDVVDTTGAIVVRALPSGGFLIPPKGIRSLLPLVLR